MPRFDEPRAHADWQQLLQSGLTQSIDRYHKGTVPLVLPITLLKQHLRQHPAPNLLQQVYLQQHPDSTHLQNAN